MSLTDIKAAVAAKLAALPNPGLVATYPAPELTGEGAGVTAGFITIVVRNGATEGARTIGVRGQNSRTHNIEIHLHLTWDESQGEALEAAFDARMEAISDTLRADPTLAGMVSLADPLVWQDDPELGWRQVRGGVLARYRKGVFRVTENKRRD